METPLFLCLIHYPWTDKQASVYFGMEYTKLNFLYDTYKSTKDRFGGVSTKKFEHQNEQWYHKS